MPTQQAMAMALCFAAGGKTQTSCSVSVCGQCEWQQTRMHKRQAVMNPNLMAASCCCIQVVGRVQYTC